MTVNLLNTRRKIILASAALSLCAVIISPYAWIGIVSLLFILGLQVYSLKDAALVFLFSLLVVSSDISEVLRTAVDAGAVLFLLYLFIRNYGLIFNTFPKLPKTVIFFIFLVIGSMVFSSLFSGDILKGFEWTARQALFFILWYIFFTNLNEEKDILKYTWTLVAAGAAVALTIIVSFLVSGASFVELFSEGLIHEGGSFKNVAAAGGIFAVSIPLTLVFVLYYSSKSPLSWFSAIIILIQVVGLFFTNSRAAIVAVIVSSAVIIFVLRKKLFYKVVISSIVAGMLLFVALPAFSELIEIYFRTGRILENTRYSMWEMSFSIISDNPIWGTGPGQFKDHMYNHIPVMLQTWEAGRIGWLYDASGMGEAHNFILFRTAELGIPGLLSAVMLPVIFLFLSGRVINATRGNKKLFYLSTGIFALGVGLFIRSFFEATGLLSHGWITRDLPFWICFAVIIFIYQNKGRVPSNHK